MDFGDDQANINLKTWPKPFILHTNSSTYLPNQTFFLIKIVKLEHVA